MKRLLLFGALLAWSGMAGAVVYKWVDAQGKLQYGDRPPDGALIELDEPRPDVDLTMDRPLFSPPLKPEIIDEPSEGTFDGSPPITTISGRSSCSRGRRRRGCPSKSA